MIVDVFVSVPQCAFFKTYFKILIEFLFLFSVKTFRNVLLILCRMSKPVFFSYLNKKNPNIFSLPSVRSYCKCGKKKSRKTTRLKISPAQFEAH